MSSWGPPEQKFLAAIKKMKKNDEDIRKCVKDLPDPNAAHTWRDAQFSLLFHASLENSEIAVEDLLDKGANPAWTNDRGTNVLHMMAKRNQLEMVKKCYKKLNKGDKKKFVDNQSYNGWTPLMTAAEYGHLDMVKYLVEKGADINKQMDTGWTAMHAAAKKEHKEILQHLIEKGGDKTLKAAHRDMGRNLEVADVTADEDIQKILGN